MMVSSMENSVVRLVAARPPNGVSPSHAVANGGSESRSEVRNGSVDAVRRPSAAAKDDGVESVDMAVQRLNDHVQKMDRTLNFSVDQDSGRSVIKVTDSVSGDLIRQIPSEDILRVAQWVADMRESSGGLLQEST
ncbi:MAG: flagellar protein FlaG [Gammaproteobacteria bacterium]|nr:flagellar protein FlaG [Gammaproteobacteria bacterium]